MSLKDEINKLIQAEREKLVAKEERRANKRQQLQTMWALLEEVAKSIDAKYLHMFFPADEPHITVWVGEIEIEYDESWAPEKMRISWQIKPNWRLRDMGGGFRVEENGSEELVFQTEEEVIQHILPKIAKAVAFCLHYPRYNRDA